MTEKLFCFRCKAPAPDGTTHGIGRCSACERDAEFVTDRELHGIDNDAKEQKAKTDAGEKEHIIETSSVIYGDTLYEQVYDPTRHTSSYIGWDVDRGTTVQIPFIVHTPDKYIPISDDLLKQKAVLLPTDAIDYGSEDQLEDDISTFIDAWLEITPEHRQKATWYVMLTWVYDKLHTIPYLRALGDYGTGKTRYLDVIGGLCYKPMYIGGAVNSAPVFRVINLWRGTAIFDEFTLRKSDESEDIIQILNNGYQKGKPVLRCDANNYEKVNAFDPYGPKIIASRKEFTDRALESRCITEIMHEKTRSDIPVEYTKEFFERQAELRNKLLQYRLWNYKAIDPDETIHVNFGDIQPRIEQSFRPFTVLFYRNPDKLQQFITQVQTLNHQQIADNSSTLDGLIVNHYLRLKDEGFPHITPNDLRDAVINDGWGGGDLNVRTVGKHLRALGFDVTIKRTGTKTPRVITIQDHAMTGLRKRYVYQDQDTPPTSKQEVLTQ